MAKLQIKKGIYWVGAVDWNMRTFHGHTYNTKRGTTYNAYLIVDDKVALVDTVYTPFTDELVRRIKEIVPLEKIDYIVVNHIEVDHSGALPEITRLCPKAKVLGTAKCKEGLFRQYYQNWDFQVVKTRDKLVLGEKSLHFIEAPMIHWPDSMFTYCPEEKILLPNDAFGQHYATLERFDSQVNACELMDEAEKYYANILWPLGGIILKKIEELKKMNISIDMIAPSHGIIWKSDPAKIIDAYLAWAGNQTKPKAVIVYETMWRSTEKMARLIAEGISDAGVEVKLFDINLADRTEVVKEMLSAKGFVFGSSTHDNDMLSSLAGFLEFLKGLSAKQRLGAAFGSYGWAGGAVKNIEGILQSAGIELALPGVSVKYAPDTDEIKRCYEFGKDFAGKILRSLTPPPVAE